MSITTVSSRAFNRNVHQAKQATDVGRVFITERGVPAYVLLRYDDYRRLVGQGPNILELLDCPGVGDVEFETPRLGAGIFRPADLG